MKNPKISVLLASYNGSNFIREQIESILSQTYSNFELVVCDDCSTDDTFIIMKEYVSTDSRIKVYQNEHNIGFKKNFERLLTLAAGEYIALSDQDDIWTDDHLEKLLSNLGENYLVCGNAYLADSEANPTGVTLLECSKFDFLPKTQDEWFFFLLHGSVFQGTACLFRKDLLPYIEPIPEEVRFHDYWIAVQASLHGGVNYFNEPILYYRQHESNVTINKKWTIFEKIKVNLKKNTSKLKKDEQISFLSAVKKTLRTRKQKKLIENAILYYIRLANFPKTIINLPYFIKNYRLMYLSNNIKFFILRLLKIFIFLK